MNHQNPAFNRIAPANRYLATVWYLYLPLGDTALEEIERCHPPLLLKEANPVAVARESVRRVASLAEAVVPTPPPTMEGQMRLPLIANYFEYVGSQMRALADRVLFGLEDGEHVEGKAGIPPAESFSSLAHEALFAVVSALAYRLVLVDPNRTDMAAVERHEMIRASIILGGSLTFVDAGAPLPKGVSRSDLLSNILLLLNGAAAEMEEIVDWLFDPSQEEKREWGAAAALARVREIAPEITRDTIDENSMVAGLCCRLWRDELRRYGSLLSAPGDRN